MLAAQEKVKQMTGKEPNKSLMLAVPNPGNDRHCSNVDYN
jgi:hypothetical protein